MSKDQKSMGRRNVIRTAPCATDPLPPPPRIMSVFAQPLKLLLFTPSEM